MFRRFFAVSTLAAMLALPACAARKPGSKIEPGFNLFSVEQDVELGRQAAQQVRQQYDVVDNQELQDYIDRVGNRLVSALTKVQGGAKFPYTFTVVNDPSINAFALPGGPTFVHTGLIKAADNEAQLAGVMAHELAHVALRHGTNQASKANLIQLPAMLAGAVVGDGGLLGQLAQLGIGLGANSVLLKYSRDAETQSDALGARVMAEAGYNPVEMARFFEKLEGEGGARPPQFLSSHPNPGNRVKAVEAELQTFPQRPYQGQSGQFERMQQIVNKLPAPSKRPQQQGQAAPPPSSAPDGNFRTLQAQNYTVSYPANWQTFGDNDSAAVTIAPREGLVQTQRGVQIGYGAMLSYYFPRSKDLQRATEELIDRLQSQNPGMQVAGNARRTRVAGSQALITNLASNSPFGQQERDVLLTVARPEGIFYMVFIAPEQDFAKLNSTFEKMLSSIQFRN